MILCCGPGRFANQFFRNMYGDLLSKKLSMGIQFFNAEPFREIGVDFENYFTHHFSETLILKEEESQKYLFDSGFVPNITYNINLDRCFCQSTALAKYILEQFAIPSPSSPYKQSYQPRIESMNPFRERYQRNNDIYIHYRIGDLIELNFLNPHEYYEKTLDRLIAERKNEECVERDERKLNCNTNLDITLDLGYKAKLESSTGICTKSETTNKIFISSDSPNHELILALVKKYNAEIVSLPVAQMILFASTCKYLILSLGTLSWLIGLYGFYSQKYFLNPKQIRYWHGPIFEAVSECGSEIGKNWHMETLKIENLAVPYAKAKTQSYNEPPSFINELGVKTPVIAPLYWREEFYSLKQYEFSKAQICFIHLPRTAGTSLQHYFSILPKLNSQPTTTDFDRANLEATNLIDLNAEQSLAVNIANVSMVDPIASVDVMNDLMATVDVMFEPIKPRIVCKSRYPVSFLCPASQYKYITIFRNPVERVWAFYQMVKKQGKNYPYKNMIGSVKYFCEQCWEANNLYTRLFAGETIEHNVPDSELLKRAKANIKLFFYVLDFEKFSEEINILRKKIHPSIYDNWAYPESVPHEQSSKYDRKISFGDKRIIEEANKLDLELYQFFKNGMV